MCGISGIYEFGTSAAVDSGVLQRMTGLLAHRGPDDAGHVVRGSVGLGHRRLSIIDLSAAGHQPMGNEAGSVWITYNGECYNYRELARQLAADGVVLRSQSDTEVLLRLYEQHGEAFLEKVDGMFALAIWDERRQSLLIARDRLGIKPLYYYADARRLLFASEMKALLADPTLPVEIDPSALGDYLRLLSIPDPRSILKNVRKLLPGHYLVASRRGTVERRYWTLDPDPGSQASFGEACEEFDERFQAAVKSHMVADVPVGAFLSGGVDSSAVVAAARGTGSGPIETFSVVFPGLQDFDESRYAARVAEHCGTVHRELALTPDLVDTLPRIAWHADEPFAVSSGFALYFLSQLARRHVKVVLTGDGSDEVFGGYPWRHADFGHSSMLYANRRLAAALGALGCAPLGAWLPQRVRAALPGNGGRDERYLRTLTCFDEAGVQAILAPSWSEPVAAAWSDSVVQQHLDSGLTREEVARKLYADVKTTMVSEMLTKVDRMTMAHGLEARVPFLDHRLVQWAFKLPGRYKVQRGQGKILVKKALERRLPAEILYRAKQGFNVPLKLWLRGELRDFARDRLAPERIARRGFFKPAAVAGIVEGHFAGRMEASNRIYALLMLDLWAEHFIDRRAAFLPV